MGGERRSVALLGIGAATGLAFASARLVWRPPDAAALPPQAVAVVNGQPIARADFERAVDAVASDRRAGLAPGDRARVLQRLVDEELLLQRALDLELARRDPRIRGQLVTTVIDTTLSGDARGEPSEEALRRFYDEHRAYFARPGRVRLVHRAVPGTGAASRERAVVLADELRAGRTPGPTPEVVTVPDALLAVAKLEQYLGPSLLQTVLALPDGGVTQPIASQGAYHVIRLAEREQEEVPPYDEVRGLVRTELVRRRGEDALRAYLDALRAEARIVTIEIDE
jgi:parvulin-like peptidyl-prolyl isomerase